MESVKVSQAGKTIVLQSYTYIISLVYSMTRVRYASEYEN